MWRGTLARAAGALVVGAVGASAQQVVFFDDFESGLGNWTPFGCSILTSTSTCGSMVGPFPSGTQAAYFADPQFCWFEDWLNSGLTQNVGVDLPAGAQSARLVFDSYEEAECASCEWDWRFVYVSADGGPWEFLGEGNQLSQWYQPSFDLTPYLGRSVRIAFAFDAVDHVANSFFGWLIDDVRIVLTDPPQTYCTGKTNSLGCVPFITTTGVPSATATVPFRIVANDTTGEVGRLWYSFKKADLSFHGGKLCIKSPLQRLTHKTPVQNGTPPCDWTLARDFNSRIQSGLDPMLTPGQTVFAQWRGRDPADPQGFGDMLTDGVRFVIDP